MFWEPGYACFAFSELPEPRVSEVVAMAESFLESFLEGCWWKNKSKNQVGLPETKAPKNWWLEDEGHPFGAIWAYFRGGDGC